MKRKLSVISPLLITNAVFAAAKVDTALTNTDERAALARNTILKIIKSSIFRQIVIADGSNYLLLTDQDLWMASNAGVEVEQIAFQQDAEKVILFGKGHGEMQIVDFALRNSKILKDNRSFYKLSGRYFLRNALQIIKVAENYSNLFFNYNPKFCLPNSQFTCSAFYKCSQDVYDNFLCHAIDYCNVQRDGRLESAFFQVLTRPKHSAISSPFPYFEGIGGTMGLPIKNTFFCARNVYSRSGGLAYSLVDIKT